MRAGDDSDGGDARQHTFVLRRQTQIALGNGKHETYPWRYKISPLLCEFKLNVPKGALGERVLPVLRGFEAGILSALFIGPISTIIEASGEAKRFSLQLKVISQRREPFASLFLWQFVVSKSAFIFCVQFWVGKFECLPSVSNDVAVMITPASKIRM